MHYTDIVAIFITSATTVAFHTYAGCGLLAIIFAYKWGMAWLNQKRELLRKSELESIEQRLTALEQQSSHLTMMLS